MTSTGDLTPSAAGAAPRSVPSTLPSAVPSSVPFSARAVAPDLARGAMLLMIALANVHLYLQAAPGLRGYPASLGLVDQVVALLQLVLVDGRAYPLFALLVGYGAVQSARRRDPAAAVAILRRRGGWMILIGALHGILLFPGDIVGAYGLLLVLFGGLLVRGRTATLVTVAAVGVLLAALLGATTAVPTGLAWPSMSSTDLGRTLLLHAGEWAAGTAANAVATVGMFAVGALAARRRLLDDPARHRPLLRRTAVLGLAAAVAAGLPLALAAIGAWQPGPTLAVVVGLAHQVGGLAGGLGFGALFGLLATRPAPRALLATGRRSLSCYLGQSVVFCALLPAWTLGLGAHLTVWQATLLGIGTWLLGVAVSAALDRAGRRGPAETVLRALTYR